LKNQPGALPSHLRGARRKETKSSRTHKQPKILVSNWCDSRLKKAFDFVLALSLILVALPLLLLIGLGVMMTSTGPMLFKQVRLGKDGRPFKIYKFRTMEHDPARWASHITIVGDPRITRFGRVLRKWKLDELPQLINVLRGEMSFVGPRPRVPQQKHDSGLLLVRPGVTGMATLAFRHEEALFEGLSVEQIKEMYGTTIVPLKTQLDRSYLGQATMLTDMTLMYRTVLSVFKYSGPAPANVEELADFCGSCAPENTQELHWSFDGAQGP